MRTWPRLLLTKMPGARQRKRRPWGVLQVLAGRQNGIVAQSTGFWTGSGVRFLGHPQCVYSFAHIGDQVRHDGFHEGKIVRIGGSEMDFCLPNLMLIGIQYGQC